eukprot:jgi/Botrbrau1/19983/Bobra.0488s0001.1
MGNTLLPVLLAALAFSNLILGDELPAAEDIAGVVAAVNGTIFVPDVLAGEPPPAPITKPMSISEAAKLLTFEHHTKTKVVLGNASEGSITFPSADAPAPAPLEFVDPTVLLTGLGALGPSKDMSFVQDILAHSPAPFMRLRKRHGALSPAGSHHPTVGLGVTSELESSRSTDENGMPQNQTSPFSKDSISHPAFSGAGLAVSEVVSSEGNGTEVESGLADGGQPAGVLDVSGGQDARIDSTGTPTAGLLFGMPQDLPSPPLNKPFLLGAGGFGNGHGVGLVIPVMGIVGFILLISSVAWVYASRRPPYTGLRDVNIQMQPRSTLPK